METKVCKKCGRELSVNCFNKAKKNKDGLYHLCKECYSKHRKESGIDKRYFEANKDKIKEYRQTEQYKIYNRKRKQTEKYKETEKRYKESELYKMRQRMYDHNRRALESKGKGLRSYKIAQEILTEWFDNRCAYSGLELTNNTLNWDHIVPLKKNGVNEIWNLVPSYNKYNNNKRANEPYKWYKQQKYYSEERLEYIIYYQKVMYWNFANKDSESLVLITGETITYEEIEREYGAN